MELNWELCRIFYQVARCRNFSRAAAMLFTSQPAVSRSMAALERELGCRLFIRNRRGVELTPEGRMFYAHVEAGCEQFRRGREELEQAVGLQSGSIALGASETALRHWLLPRLDRFHALYPGVRLRLFGGTSRQAIDELKSGAIDFAVAAVPGGWIWPGTAWASVFCRKWPPERHWPPGRCSPCGSLRSCRRAASACWNTTAIP